MDNQKIKILAIESSCDDTAAAVIGVDPSADGNQPVILSNIVSSQIDLHAKTGGVVPEVASRAHMEAIVPVISEALLAASSRQSADPTNYKLQTTNYQEAIKLLDGITHIAVTAGPGLIGSLLVGFNAAKTIAFAKNLPIIPINHIEGHIYSALSREISNSEFLIPNEIPKSKVKNDKTIQQYSNLTIFPVLALTVSGGHTSLTLMKDHGDYEEIGQTIDDAVGEAYDKVAKLLGLGYPGGPEISKLAQKFRNNNQISNIDDQLKNNTTIQQYNNKIIFPRPIINDGSFNFSLSGLKTAVLVWTKKYLAANSLSQASEIPAQVKEEIAAAFEEAVADVLCFKTKKACEKYGTKTVIFAGGVSANAYLRARLESSISNKESENKILFPSKGLYGDNAAMIGIAAYYHIKNGKVSAWDGITVDSNWELC